MSCWVGHRFPPIIGEQGTRVAVEEAEAAQAEDRANILRILSGIEATGLAPPASHIGGPVVLLFALLRAACCVDCFI